MNPITGIIRDFINLLYPEICAACSINLLKNEHFLCTRCSYQLPRTRFHHDSDNPINRLFWGRVKIEQATALFFYRKGSRYQSLIHKLKYKGRKEIGYELGKMLGTELIKYDSWKEIDVIIPVPLHPKRERKRGYNQAFWIAMGMANSMKKEINDKILLRAKETPTQTRKGKYERWENVDSVFSLHEPELLAQKHILLVDDVITTGSTTEACVQILHKAAPSRVSVAALGTA